MIEVHHSTMPVQGKRTCGDSNFILLPPVSTLPTFFSSARFYDFISRNEAKNQSCDFVPKVLLRRLETTEVKQNGSPNVLSRTESLATKEEEIGEEKRGRYEENRLTQPNPSFIPRAHRMDMCMYVYTIPYVLNTTSHWHMA